jgi:tetrahydromethanopterin S-methyltransferase subunit F
MEPHEITITIRKPEDLFVDSSDENPMQPDWEADSGLQRVADFLTVRRLRRGVRIIVQYPDTWHIPPEGPEALKEAVDRYCDARIAENSRIRKFTILTGLTGLAYGVLVSLLLSIVFTWLLSILPFPEWLESSLVGLVGIAVWAIVWGPLAAIFFDWLPNWTAIRVYRTIKRGQFVLTPTQRGTEKRIFQPGPLEA